MSDFATVPAAEEAQHALPLAVALLLSSAVGLERQFRAKSAGLRTHTLVGVGAALFMLISKFGFADVADGATTVLDPSRVAAQVVSGIGFIGAGLIFVRRDDVRGLTTAASIWLTAAIGMAAGAGLIVLAAAATAGHFLVVLGLAPLARRVAGRQAGRHELHLAYRSGAGVLRQSLVAAHRLGFVLSDVTIRQDADDADDAAGAADAADAADDAGRGGPAQPGVVLVDVLVEGRRPVADLVGVIGELPGMVHVRTADEDWDAA